MHVGSVAWTTAVAFALALASGCSVMGGVPAYRVIRGDVDDLPPASLALAAERSATALASMPASRTFDIGGREISVAELAASARHVAAQARLAKDPSSLTARLAKDCLAFRSGEVGRVTAYYEPVLAARRRFDRRFRYPIYRMPSKEQIAALERRLGHVPTRADIDRRGVLRAMDLELAWVDDPVALFFLQVQGSGRLVFEEGSDLRAGFAGTNGLPYKGIGDAMREHGLLDKGRGSSPAMRDWLGKHPAVRDGLMDENPRYVFFRDTGSEGPIGALGTTLVPGRSIAVDQRHVPRGVLAWLRTKRPLPGVDGCANGSLPLTRFVFAQDAGVAIQGPGRVDLYAGSGEEAGYAAGLMREDGELEILICAPSWR